MNVWTLRLLVLTDTFRFYTTLLSELQLLFSSKIYTNIAHLICLLKDFLTGNCRSNTPKRIHLIRTAVGSALVSAGKNTAPLIITWAGVIIIWWESKVIFLGENVFCYARTTHIEYQNISAMGAIELLACCTKFSTDRKTRSKIPETIQQLSNIMS